MDKRPSRSRSTTNSRKSKESAKSPAKATAKSPAKASKSAVAIKKKTSGRSKSRSKPARSRSRSRSRPEVDRKSKVKTQSSGGRSRSKKSRSKTPQPTSTIEVTSSNAEKILKIVDRQPNVVMVDVLQENFIGNDRLNEIIRRSISREPNLYDISVRRSTRLTRKADEYKFPSLDEDVLDKRSDYSERISPSYKAPSLEFGGVLGSLFGILFIPLFVLAIHLACTRNQCTLSKFHIPDNWNVYFKFEASIMVFGFLMFQTLLSILPVGRIVEGTTGNRILYRCNGLLAVLTTAAVISGLWYFKYPVTMVYEKYFPLLVSSVILGPVLALCLYWKGKNAPVPGLNQYGMTDKMVYNFFVGREINPILFGLINVKVVLLRTAIIGTLTLSGLMVLKTYETRHELSYALICYMSLLTLLCLDFYWFEDSFSTTFESLYEGTGAMVIQSYLLYPFLATLAPKYIIQQRVELSVYAITAIVVCFLIGFLIYRASNLQKSTFRKNPLNPALAHFETIPTSRGKRLLVSGWWGWVRHPNYLGDIILNCALTATVGFKNAIPYIPLMLMILMLLHRAKRDSARCRGRYRSAWDEYTNRVRYHIIPRVY